MEIVLPLTEALNSPLTIGSQPAQYCHLVSRITKDISFPFWSFSVGMTENSSEIVAVFRPPEELILIGTFSSNVPMDWDLPATPLRLCTFFLFNLRPSCYTTSFALFSEKIEESKPVSIIA